VADRRDGGCSLCCDSPVDRSEDGGRGSCVHIKETAVTLDSRRNAGEEASVGRLQEEVGIVEY
jgi:hypothetical protein